MKKLFLFICILSGVQFSLSQVTDSTKVYKKRVLDATEVDFLASYYSQDGENSAVSGGVGSEKLTDIASNIVIAIPLNQDDVLTIDAGISAYTSASSSNINPYDSNNPNPWQASSGASQQDALTSLSVSYSHSSDSRNFIWNADLSFSNEYDYTSFGIGGGIVKLFNHKNTEISLKANAYLDSWRPIYPKELILYKEYGSNFNSSGIISGSVYDESGNTSNLYNPTNFDVVSNKKRNSYSLSFAYSQVVNKKMQFSLFFDVLQQQGLLSTPYQRVYFADKNAYYYGNPQYIPNYTNSQNTGVYRLADDNENLPSSRFKIPIGFRYNYYLSEKIALRTYYRFYSDDWSVQSHTASIELPYKITDKFTVFPMFRYYTQIKSKYFAPFDTHLSTEEYYTSDYDLSTFNSNQFGFGLSYTDIFANFKVLKYGLKNIDFRFNHYTRSDGLMSNIGTIGLKFIGK
jgi:Protein of unknown function (DUF3570)